MSTFIIIPTYNEKENLPTAVEAVFRHLPDGHVLIVDDRSPDGTGDLAEALREKWGGRLHVLHRSKKEGLGPAYIAGFGYALERGAEKIIEMDADLSHPVEALPQMIALSDQYDLVIGSRYVPGGSTPDWPLSRRLISRGGNLYARIILGMAVRDTTSGFRCYRRKVLENIPLKKIESKGYGFQVEMTYRSYLKGYSIVEMPIIFRDRRHGKSKMGLSIALEAAVKVWKIKWNI
jgi:dolichol-phosphate mannosyltransferase